MPVFTPKVPKNNDSNLSMEKDGITYRVSVKLKRADGTDFYRQARRIDSKREARSRRNEFYEEFNILEGGEKFAQKLVLVEPAVPKGITLRQWAEQCIEKHWPRTVPATTKDYTLSIRKYVLPKLGDVELKELTANHVRALIYEIAETPVRVGRPKKQPEKEVNQPKGKPAEKPTAEEEPKKQIILSLSSLKAIKTALGSCLTLAVEHGHIETNVSNQLQMRWEGIAKGRRRASESDEEEQERRAPLTQAEIATILKAARSYSIYPAVLLMAKMGLRISEALAVRLSDFDMKAKTLKVRKQVDRIPAKHGSKLVLVDLKTKASRRDIPIPKSVEEYLASLDPTGDKDKPLSSTDIGSWPDPRNANRAWTALISKTEIKPLPTPHDLRHAFVSHLLNDQKETPTIVQALVGHSDVRTTLSFYSKASTKNLRDAMGQDTIQAAG